MKCVWERCSSTSHAVYRSGRYPDCSSALTMASHCPPFKATDQPKRIYWCAELPLNHSTFYYYCDALKTAHTLRNSITYQLLGSVFRETCNQLTLTFLSEGSAHHILPDIILLGQVEELTDPAGSLGTQAARHSAVSQARDVLLTCRKVQ